MPHTPDGEDPEKTILEKLRDEFGASWGRHNLELNSREDIVKAFEICDGLDKTRESMEAELDKGTFKKAADKCHVLKLTLYIRIYILCILHWDTIEIITFRILSQSIYLTTF